MIDANVGSIRDPLKQDLALYFYKKQNNYINILTEAHIKHDQILHIRNNWLGLSFSLLELVTQIDLLLSFIQVLKVSLRLTLVQKGDLCPSKLLSLITEFSVFVPLKGITPESSWLKGVSLKDYKIIWKINVREMKTKLYLKTLILLWIKWTGVVEMKHKDFIDVVPKAQDLQSYKIC